MQASTVFCPWSCEVERCLWQMQRSAARAKQREAKQRAGFDRVLPLVMRSFQSFLYFLPKQLMILNSCCISRPLFSGGFLLGGGGAGGGGGGGRGTPRRRDSSSAKVGGSKGPTQRTYCSTPIRPRSDRTCSARTKAQVRGWGGGEGGPGGQSGRFWFIYPFIPIVYALLPSLVPEHSQPRRRIR